MLLDIYVNMIQKNSICQKYEWNERDRQPRFQLWFGAVRFVFQPSYAIEHEVCFQETQWPRNLMEGRDNPGWLLQNTELWKVSNSFFLSRAQKLLVAQIILYSEQALRIPRTNGPATRQDGRERPISGRLWFCLNFLKLLYAFPLPCQTNHILKTTAVRHQILRGLF